MPATPALAALAEAPSERELEVLRPRAAGKHNRQIAWPRPAWPDRAVPSALPRLLPPSVDVIGS